MSCLGVHFALTGEEVQNLKKLPISERISLIRDVLEVDYFENRPEFKAETAKAWDAIHRIFCEGQLVDNDPKHYPYNLLILGGEALGNEDYLIYLVTPEQVKVLHQALQNFSMDQFKENYYKIDEENYGVPVDDDDYAYTLEFYTELKTFLDFIVDKNLFMVFTADQ